MWLQKKANKLESIKERHRLRKEKRHQVNQSITFLFCFCIPFTFSIAHTKIQNASSQHSNNLRDLGKNDDADIIRDDYEIKDENEQQIVKCLD